MFLLMDDKGSNDVLADSSQSRTNKNFEQSYICTLSLATSNLLVDSMRKPVSLH